MDVTWSGVFANVTIIMRVARANKKLVQILMRDKPIFLSPCNVVDRTQVAKKCNAPCDEKEQRPVYRSLFRVGIFKIEAVNYNSVRTFLHTT